MGRSLLLLAIMSLLSAAHIRAAEPLKMAWENLVATPEHAAELDKMTSAQRYVDQVQAILAAQKSVRGKKFFVRLKCIAVIEPPERDKLMLVHGQYVDDEYQNLFGKDATIGIWTPDYKTALKLKVDEEFEIHGIIIHKVYHSDNDVGQVPTPHGEATNYASVAYLRTGLTHWVRDARILMVSPKIVRLPEGVDRSPKLTPTSILHD